MPRTTLAERLRDLLELRHLSQAELANKSKIDKDTINKLLRGRDANRRPRHSTLHKLAKALDVEVEVLEGTKQMPRQTTLPQSWVRRQIAEPRDWWQTLALVAQRYRAAPRQVLDVAPLCFAILAEQSLRHRQTRLDDLRAAQDRLRALQDQSPHLGAFPFIPRDADHIAVGAEGRSIAQRDISGRIVAEERDEDHATEHDANPWHSFLCAQASALGLDIGIDGGALWAPELSIDDDALKSVAGEDEDLLLALRIGAILLVDIPRSVRSDDRLAERQEWMRNYLCEHPEAADLVREQKELDQHFEKLLEGKDHG